MSAAEQLSFEPLLASSSGIRAHRSGALYGVHAYHTKVPPKAIVECIQAHTRPGDLVLDPFCGSGMTGVAASMSGRRAVLNDLSPAAVHIAYNYVAPCDPAKFAKAVDRVLADVGDTVAAMYATTHGGGNAVVEYVVWSDVRACRRCHTRHLLWDFRESGLRRIVCPSCGTPQAKSEMPLVGEAPVETNLSVAGRRRVTRAPADQDLAQDRIPAALPWVPSVPFDADRPMWRRGHQDLGINTAADFYSARNLAAMSLLWESASREGDARVRSALRFSLTAIANRASRRYQWNAKRPTNVLSGTLYVSSLRYEWNVLSLWRRKIAAVSRLFTQNRAVEGAVRVLQGSATALPLDNESVDYCFTDPPFGAHIVYSDASLLWEAWLDDLTDRTREAIVVSGGSEQKSVESYGHLLQQSFAEVNRVLKPGGRATVVFQATDPAVWAAVQRAARAAGLSLVGATTLEKGQPSFKQIKGQLEGERVATTDVVLTFTKGATGKAFTAATPRAIVAAALREAGETCSVQHLFAVVNARLLESGGEIMSFDELRSHLESSATDGPDEEVAA